MKHRSILLVLVILLWVSSGCLDVVEELTLHQDGSGSYRMQVDFAQSGEGEDPETAALRFLSRQGADLDSLRIDLDHQEGIRNAYFKTEGGVLSWGYDFEHLDAMKSNRRFRELGREKGFGPARYALERADKKRYWLVRRHIPADLTEGIGAGNFFRNLGSKLVGEGSYTLIYHMPARVREVDHPLAMLSDRKRKVTLQIPLQDWIADPRAGDFRVKFKRKRKYREPW